MPHFEIFYGYHPARAGHGTPDRRQSDASRLRTADARSRGSSTATATNARATRATFAALIRIVALGLCMRDGARSPYSYRPTE